MTYHFNFTQHELGEVTPLFLVPRNVDFYVSYTIYIFFYLLFFFLTYVEKVNKVCNSLKVSDIDSTNLTQT
jgi:hypothetical protein